MYTLPTRIPTTSSDLLKLFFDKTPADLGALARDVTEMQSPQTQGKNALNLAKYIKQLGKTHPYYSNAEFFVEQWESNNCYVCGLTINEGQTMELEHVLPIAEALALTGIIQENMKKFGKETNLKELSQTFYAKNYLLEYARSHRCCNQIKGATSFLSFDLSAPDDMKKYTPNLIGINRVLNDIWGQGTGTATKKPKWQEDNGCANPSFRSSLQNMSKNTFIENRRTFIIEYYITPIILEINDLISKTNFNFAQLVFLANQSMSIDQSIWKTLEGKKMNEVSVDDILTKLSINTQKLDYKSTREAMVPELMKIIENTPRLKEKAIQYINSNLSLSGSNKRESKRNVDKNTLLGFLNIDYTFYTQLYIENITRRNEVYSSILTENNEGVYGFQYMYYLLTSQDYSITFTDDQIKNFNEMMINVNNFMILYVYIYLIFYNPFKDIKKDQKIDNSAIDYSKISFKTDISELSQFNLELQTKQGMGQIHENYCSQIFSNLNYLIQQEKVGKKDEYIYTNIRELENYGIFVAKSTDEIVVANDLIQFAELANIEYNKELVKYDQLVNTTKGGVKRNKKLYKKTRKNKSKRNKYTTRTLEKRKTRKLKKIKSRRTLRYSKIY
jgi:hypothetical protein